MKLEGRLLFATGVLLAAACGRGADRAGTSVAADERSHQRGRDAGREDERREISFRWDIVHSTFNQTTINPDGQASARAQDESAITLRGSGTFERGEPQEVTGGGTWRIRSGGVETSG